MSGLKKDKRVTKKTDLPKTPLLKTYEVMIDGKFTDTEVKATSKKKAEDIAVAEYLSKPVTRRDIKVYVHELGVD